MKRTVLIEKDRGVFIGAFSGYAIFSKDPIGLSRAYAFKSTEIAKDFVSVSLKHFANNTIYVELDLKEEYASCVDLIKAGYGEYVHHMIDGLYMPSEEIH
jgi:hypothetical protein